MRSATDGAPSFVHVPGLASAGPEVVIDGEEAHYLKRVVRIRAGERVTATDGAGTLAELLVNAIGESVRAEARDLRTVERGPVVEVWCGAPEGDRADWLVEKLAELGVASLKLVDADRGRWERAGQRSARWDRLTLAALRQSRSAWRMAVGSPEPLATATGTRERGVPAWLADPEGVRFEIQPEVASNGACLAIGPSGGFSAGELKSLEGNGFLPTRLTANRLRTETAALALASLVLSSAR